MRLTLVLASAACALGWSPMTPPNGATGAAASNRRRLLMPDGANQPSQLLRAPQPAMMPIGTPKVAYRVPGGECLGRTA